MTLDASQPYLSVVVTTRNDDHGGDPLKRLQALVNTFDAQCRRNGLDAELIVVEWNPPPDRPSVGSLLRLPDPSFCTVRFIEVPPALHQRLQHADLLPLFQMIAKNVGIRRARGRFVLATNIDIIFSNELMAYIAARQLKPGHLYRVDRHDIQPNVAADAPLEAVMDYCRSHQLRVHARWGSFPVDALGRQVSLPDDIVDGRTVRLGTGWHMREGDTATRFRRWASDVVELIVDTGAAGLTGQAVVDVEIESNPYDRDSWIEIAAMEGDQVIVRARVTGQARVAIPLGATASGGDRRIELRVTGWDPASRLELPTFERREALHYRVFAARLRPLAPVDSQMFKYPASDWNPTPHSRVRLTRTTDGSSVETDPRKQPHAIVDYGPMRAAHDGLYRFNVTCTMTSGAVSFGVLTGDRQEMPVAVNRHWDGGQQRFEIAVDLHEGQRFWVAAFNKRPGCDVASRFIIHRLEGSDEPARLMIPSVSTDGSSPVRQRWRRWAGALADGVARALATAIGHRLRYRIVRDAPEFKGVEEAQNISGEQLQALEPLRYLGDFHKFLHERRPDNLHVNGCGDFQLMAREHWDELRAYPELETFSMNIDGLLSYVADAAGIKEQMLDMAIYHLEHEVGSGWSPEGEALLRRRIAERGITWIDASTVYIWAAYMRWLGRPMIFNQSDWGLAGSVLPETVRSPISTEASR